MKRSPLIILFVTVVIDLLGFGIILPLLPLYVNHFGGGPIVAGWLAATFSIMQFLFAPLWGRLSDLHGRRPFILLGLIGSFVSFLIYGFATQLWMLFAARTMAGILTAASLPTAQAYIADVMPPEKRSRGMALIGVAFGVGFATGPWIGGQLGKYGLGMPAFFVAGLALVNFIWSYFALPESHTIDRDNTHARKVVFFDTQNFKNAFRNATLGELLTVFTTASFAFSLMEATFTWFILYRFIMPGHAIMLHDQSLEKSAAATVGPIFGVVGITAVFSQGAVMGGLAQRMGEVKLVWLGSLMLAVTLYLISGTHNLTTLTVLAACLAAGNGLLTPSLSSLVSKAAGKGERGALMGVQQSLGSFSRIIAPPLGTWLLQRFGTGIPYFTSAILMTVAFFLSLGIHRSIEKEDLPENLSELGV
jgi:MFS family permease